MRKLSPFLGIQNHAFVGVKVTAAASINSCFSPVKGGRGGDARFYNPYKMVRAKRRAGRVAVDAFSWASRYGPDYVVDLMFRL